MAERENRDNKRRGGGNRPKKEQSEFDQQIVDIARVTRVMAGGKRMRFRVCLLIGDRKGRVGMGLAKGKDVQMAVQKAYKKAEKDMIKIVMIKGTIPHEVYIKQGAAKVILKPAPEGTGVIAGGACRLVLEIAGVKNAVAKILGTNNKINNVKAVLLALSSLKYPKSKIVKEKVEVAEVKEEKGE